MMLFTRNYSAVPTAKRLATIFFPWSLNRRNLDIMLAQLTEPQPAATPPAENELIEQRRAARKVFDAFTTDSAAADAARSRAEAIGPIRPSDICIAGLTVGRLMELMNLASNGNTPMEPAELTRARAECRRLIENYQEAKQFLWTSADPKLHHQLAELRERHRTLAHDAHPAYAFDESTGIAERMKTELARRAAQAPSFTERRPENDDQLRFDKAAAESILSRLPPAVVARGRAAQHELNEVVAEIERIEAAILMP
jgi:hypothetical protein